MDQKLANFDEVCEPPKQWQFESASNKYTVLMDAAKLAIEPVDDEPHLEIRDWSFVEVRRGAKVTLHVVGAEPNLDGYVSPELVVMDPLMWRFRAVDGTVLQLVDERGTTLSADYTLGRWQRANGRQEVRDVTLDVVGMLRRRRGA